MSLLEESAALCPKWRKVRVPLRLLLPADSTMAGLSGSDTANLDAKLASPGSRSSPPLSVMAI
eukprot:6510355-Prymnesium_polylepis.1